MSFRKSNTPRLSPECARRQGNISRLAFVLLGRESAITFLNDENAELGARPIDLAIASEAGCASVEQQLRRMTCRLDEGEAASLSGR